MIEWHELLLVHVMNKGLINKFFAHVHKQPPLAIYVNRDDMCNNNFHFSLPNMSRFQKVFFFLLLICIFCPHFIPYVLHAPFV